VTALCLFAVTRGWAIVAIERTRPLASEEAPVDQIDQAAVNIIGTGRVAAAQQRAEALSRLLAVRPLAPSAWLSLAEARLVIGAPYKDVLGALKMSSVTGPNEAAVMWRRGLFAVSQWEALPPDFRQRAALDLAGPAGSFAFDDSDAQLLQRLLGAKSSEARAQIAALLRLEGTSDATLARIGLGAPGE